jgi:anthranilate phosphoribosyltransferase
MTKIKPYTTLILTAQAGSLEAGLVKAEESVDSGAAYRKLCALREFTTGVN